MYTINEKVKFLKDYQEWDTNFIGDNPIELLNDELKNDIEVGMKVLELQRMNDIQFLGERLRDDKDFMIKACEVSVAAYMSRFDTAVERGEEVEIWADYPLEYASDRLKSDKEFIVKVVEFDKINISLVGDDLRYDKEVLLAAVKVDNEALQYAEEKVIELVEVSGGDVVKVLEAAIDLEKRGHEIKSDISVLEQKERIDLADKISTEFSEKDKIKEDYYNKLSGGQSQEKKMKI